jgi:outer membrane protein TolC
MRNNRRYARAGRSAALRFLAAFFLAALPLGLFGQAAPDSITVEEAVSAALAGNLAVKSMAVESRIKKRASDLSFNHFLPSVSISGTAAQLNQVTPVLVATAPLPTGTYYAPSRTNLVLGLTIQEVFNATFFGLMDQAAIDYQRSLITKAQAERSVAASVRKIFYQLIVQDQAIELTRSRLESAKERLRQAEVLYRLGQGTELNYSYARMGVENLIPDLRSMESARAAGLSQFQEVLGFDPNPAMKLDGNLDVATVPVEGLSISADDRFDVRQSRQTEKQLESALKIQRYALLPSLILQYSADPMLNGPGETNPLTGGTTSIFDSANWNQQTGALSITLSWSLDALLPASTLRVAKAEVQDRLAFARESTVQALRASRDDAANQLRAIRDSVEKIGNLTNAVDASKRVYDLTNAAYQLGTGRILDLQDAEVAWQGTRIQLLYERLNLASLVFDLEAKYQNLEIAKPRAGPK